jgi:hypothetical protein
VLDVPPGARRQEDSPVPRDERSPDTAAVPTCEEAAEATAGDCSTTSWLTTRPAPTAPVTTQAESRRRARKGLVDIAEDGSGR